MADKTTVRFTADDLAILARLHEATGLDHSGIIRLAIRRLLATEPTQEDTMSRNRYLAYMPYGWVVNHGTQANVIYRCTPEQYSAIASHVHIDESQDGHWQSVSYGEARHQIADGQAQMGDAGELLAEMARQDAYDAALKSEH